MPFQLPQATWPDTLLEQGPPEDPSILLAGEAMIGDAPHRVVAVRINPRSLAIDYRTDIEDTVYADYQIEEMLDELTFLEDIDRSVLVPMGGNSFAVWMIPSSGKGDD